MPVMEKPRVEEIELHFLLETDTEWSRSRRREAVFASIVAHLAVIILMLVQPKLFHSAVDAVALQQERKLPERLIYLEAPPDNQVVKQKPKTDILSDKDRLAQAGIPEVRAPKLPPPPQLPPAPPAEKRGAPGSEGDKKQVQAPPPPPQVAQNQSLSQALGKQAEQQTGQSGPLQLQDLKRPDPKLALPQSGMPGKSIEEAMREAARSRAGSGPSLSDLGGGGGGEPQFTPRTPAVVGQAQILTDTQGVDFDPYLRRVVGDIRRNWYAVMPEIARLGKRGRVIVIFEVQRDGGVPKLYLATTSGSEPLDRAALAGISASVPFPPLPAQFRGPLIRLQVTFLYNMHLSQPR